MMKVTKLDGIVVCRAEDPVPVRLHAPRWWRVDRHLKWLFTPPQRRAVVTIKFLGPAGSIIARDVRAVVEA